jgi:hypothetical protein
MICLSCGLENPSSALRCDCGRLLETPKRSGPQVALDRLSIALDVIRRLIYLLPLFGAIYGANNLFTNWDAQKTAPQQAALAGYALAWAVIPYCFARAFSGISSARLRL